MPIDSFEATRSELRMYVVYDHPFDYPDEFVARGWVYTGPNAPRADPDIFARGPTLASVRGQLPGGVYNLGRYACDDPKIVEVWI
jgi:hypothetical protein